MGSTSVLRVELQPEFKHAADGANSLTRGNANRLIAPLGDAVKRRTAQMLVATAKKVMDDSATSRDITKPVDEDAPITGGKYSFDSRTVTMAKYGPAEFVLADSEREEAEDQGLSLEREYTAMLAMLCDDIHYYHVFAALQDTSNYLSAATAVGNLADPSIKIGTILAKAVDTVQVSQLGAVTHLVCNATQLLYLNQMFDASGRGRTAIAKGASEAAQTLGYEGPSRFEEWLRSSLNLGLIVDRRSRIAAGAGRRFLDNTNMALIACGQRKVDPAFLRTATYGFGLPGSDRDLGVVKTYRCNNPDGEKFFAESRFAVYPAAETGSQSPNGLLLSCTIS